MVLARVAMAPPYDRLGPVFVELVAETGWRLGSL